jgi:hypothetical protein
MTRQWLTASVRSLSGLIPPWIAEISRRRLVWAESSKVGELNEHEQARKQARETIIGETSNGSVLPYLTRCMQVGTTALQAALVALA